MKRIFFMVLISSLLSVQSNSQHLRAGFQKKELVELLRIGARTTSDSIYSKKFPEPDHSKMLYQSAPVGFNNLWQLWMRNDSVAIISIRGTTPAAISFLANIYAAMVPARGNLELEKDFSFKYELSGLPNAAVHVGYLVAMAYLSRDILPKIDSCLRQGINEFIITGHSQGGAISYLLRAYMEQLKNEGRIPGGAHIKTYTIAAPKPGNLYFAYEYEHINKGGWAYQVVNPVDWVPEVPFSIQTMDDLSETNPFRNVKQLIGKQKFPLNIGASLAYKQLSKPAKKARRQYEKWLGKRVGKLVKKSLKEFTTPAYYGSNNYVRTGTTVVLMPDSSYFQNFPEVRDSIWHNHTQRPYLFLAEKLEDNGNAETPAAITRNPGALKDNNKP